MVDKENFKNKEASKIRKEQRRRAKKVRRKKRIEIHDSIPKEIKSIDIDSLYYPYKSWMDDFKKYWRNGENTVFKISSSPWTIFVEDYLVYGDKIYDNLSSHVLCSWGWGAYKKVKRNIDNIHPKKMDKNVHVLRSAKRLIRIMNSIKIYGYCGGEYNSDDNIINVVRNYTALNGNIGYKLLWGNRRAAVCAGLGIKKIKVKCWDYYKSS